MITDAEINDACHKHGAKMVSDAAYAAMNGNTVSLRLVELGAAQGLAELTRITTVAYSLMDATDQAMDLTQSIIDLAKLPRDAA